MTGFVVAALILWKKISEKINLMIVDNKSKPQAQLDY